MIYKHDMLSVTQRAMHNPRASWFTVRPLSEKPVPYPFRVEHEAVPAVAVQFAVEHPTDANARRVITIATCEHGYAVWCGDKFTQGDVTALDASLRVAMAVSDLPPAYVEGARAAMMSLYGSYPHRAPCHFWHAWHKDQGVCKHVAAALQFVERTHPGGILGLLENLDDVLKSLTTAPLAELLATRPGAGEADEVSADAGNTGRAGHLSLGRIQQPAVGKPLAAIPSLAELTSNPALKQFFHLASANPAAPAEPDDATLEALKSLGNAFLKGPLANHPMFVRLVQRATPADPTSAPQMAPNGNAEYASRLAVQAQARLVGLVPNIVPKLKHELMNLAGKDDAAHNFIVWPLMRIVSTNEQLRANAEYKSSSNLLFISSTSDEAGMFALQIDADGGLRRPDVYRWDQKTKKVEWYAEDLAIYERRRASEG